MLVSKSKVQEVSIASIRFLDIGIMKFTSPLYSIEVINESLLTILYQISDFEFNTKQSNALLYYIYKLFIACSSVVLNNESQQHDDFKDSTQWHSMKLILSDWFFDLTLLQNSLIKDSVGSIISGLSFERLERLTCKQEQWTATEIKQFKLNLISSFSKSWLPSNCIIPILLSCLCSEDQDVKNEAIFKINGAYSLYNIKLYCIDIFNTLVNLCLPDKMRTLQNSTSTSEKDNSLFYQNRTQLSDKLKIAILEFIIKEMLNINEINQIIVNSQRAINNAKNGLCLNVYY